MARNTPVIPVLILLNLAVYLLWHFVDQDHFLFVADNFTVSWTGLTEGRWWTLVSAEFSHNMLLHFLINMFVLNSFGRLLSGVLGLRRFLTLYLSAAIVASVTHAAVSAFVLGSPDMPAVGASGAIAGLILVFSLMFPRERILLFGLVPLPALFGALVFVALDIWGLVAQAEGGGLPIGHGAHLGGALCGFLYYVFFLRSQWRKVRHLYG